MAVTKTAIGTTHVLAECRDCDWSEQDYLTAEKKAFRHAKSRGHTVIVERAQSWTYNPKSDDR